jgi:hypothetical protein
MGAVKKYFDITGRKLIVAQSTVMEGSYYPGATHPTVNENGQNVCCNKPMWNMLKPLIESQPYVHSFEEYQGQHCEIDFDVIRGKTFVNLPHGAIQCWVSYAFPDLAFDLSRPWIEINGKCPEHISKQVKGKVILNFTERYRNTLLDYFFLRNYSPDLIFAGTEKEHFLFTSKWGLNIPRLELNDFLEYAHALKESRFFIGNQSMGWNLAEAMKTPRVLEVCQYAQNCQPCVGENSFGYFHQMALEYYFRRLYNETMNK